MIKRYLSKFLNNGLALGFLVGAFLDIDLFLNLEASAPPWVQIIIGYLSSNVFTLGFIFRANLFGMIILMVLNAALWALTSYLWFSRSFHKIVIGTFILFLNIFLPVIFWKTVSLD